MVQKGMSDQSKFAINDVKKGRRYYPPKDCGWDRPSTIIRMPGSFSDQGGEFAEDGILRRSGTHRVRLGAWLERLGGRSLAAPSTYS
jgi:hypothetical protein